MLKDEIRPGRGQHCDDTSINDKLITHLRNISHIMRMQTLLSLLEKIHADWESCFSGNYGHHGEHREHRYHGRKHYDEHSQHNEHSQHGKQTEA